MLNSDLKIPTASGSYLLVLYLRRSTTVQVGRLGSFSLPRGWYCYAGSAFGPGGLKARLGHHLRPLQRYHWHIDYLRCVAELRAVFYQAEVNNEHFWSAALAATSEGSVPLPGFGASDCKCHSHLTYFPRRPPQRQLRNWLENSKNLRCCRL